jgi:hypothetical protein
MALLQLTNLGVHNLCITWVPGDLDTLSLMIPSKYNFNYKSEPALFDEKNDANNKMFNYKWCFDEIIKNLDEKIEYTNHTLKYINKNTFTHLYNFSEKLFLDILNFKNDLWKLCEEFKNIELFRISPLVPNDNLFEDRSLIQKQRIINSLLSNHSKKMNDFMELWRKIYNKFEEGIDSIIKFPKENNIKTDIFGKCLENEGFEKTIQHKLKILKELQVSLNTCKDSYIELLKNDKNIDYNDNDFNITSYPTKFKFNNDQMSLEIDKLKALRSIII